MFLKCLNSVVGEKTAKNTAEYKIPVKITRYTAVWVVLDVVHAVQWNNTGLIHKSLLKLHFISLNSLHPRVIWGAISEHS